MRKVKQIPWARRVQGPASAAEGQPYAAPQPCQQLLQAPVPSIMLGTALLSGQPCILWNSEYLLDETRKGPQTRAWTLLETLLKLIQSADPHVEQDGYVLLFHFLVEPFALMNRSNVFYPLGETPQSPHQHL